MADFKTKTADEFRDIFLTSISNDLALIGGIDEPNISYGSDHYIIATALGNIAEQASENAKIAADAQMIDTAEGDDLYRIAAIYGLALREAGSSYGKIRLQASMPTGIATGTELIDPTGLKYEVLTGGTFKNGDLIEIVSIDKGAQCNIPAGTILKWVNPPPYVNPTCEVHDGGMVGGIDAEDDEGLRGRVIERLRNPPGGGNWAQLVDIAERHSIVQKAFCYPAFNGPSTVMVAVCTRPTSENKGREILPTVVNDEIYPSILAEIFEGINLKVVSCKNLETSLSIGISLPNAPSSPVPGQGGGWLDGNPFPMVDISAGIKYCDVLSVDSPTVFTVRSAVPPVLNTSRIVYLDKDWNIKRAIVTNVQFINTNEYKITINNSFDDIEVGDYIFPDAFRMDVYIQGILDVFSKLGPGEITNIAGLLPHALRRPHISSSWPSSLGPNSLREITNLGQEIYNINFIDAYYDWPGIIDSYLTPPLPTNVMNGPNILIPKKSRIGFYPISVI